MTDPDELTSRMRALEVEVIRLREGAFATRTLASMADRDVGEVRAAVRAQTEILNALRATQLEQAQTLTTLAEAVAGMVTALDQQSETLAEIAATVDQLTGDA